MDKEREAIGIIHEALGTEVQDVFDTDAQNININGKQFLFTTDEYSAEDFFRDDNPHILGWNLVTATLSDILAAGGTPSFYGHSMTIPGSWDKNFLKEFCKGIKDCLEEEGTSFIGGDTGFADAWKYTGIAIGKLHVPLKRSGARAGDIIYCTGNVGAGNLEATLKIYGSEPSTESILPDLRVKFPSRGKEAEIIRKYATSCTDSSDGMLKALMNIAASSNLGFHAEKLNYMKEAMMVCKALDLDKTLLFMGECGEYELVFTIPAGVEEDFLANTEKHGLSVSGIGIMTASQKYLLKENDRLIDFTAYNIHARDYRDVKDYISAISQFLSGTNVQ